MSMKRRDLDERNRHICTLRVVQGLTPAQICKRLKLSRGIVNGVLWREGLSVSRKATYNAPKPAPKPKAEPKPKTVKQAALEEVKAVAIEPIPLGTDSGCQWIHGDARERVMCGHTVKGRSAWCPHHHARVYQWVV